MTVCGSENLLTDRCIYEIIISIKYCKADGIGMTICDKIKDGLFAMQDAGYRDFHSKLMPNIDKERVIGVRTPQARKYANQVAKNPDVDIFLNNLPHYYYEENNIHAFVIEKIKDYDECIKAVEKFLPFVDNWATCDLMKPKVFRKNKEKLIKSVEEWLKSDQAYTIRFGSNMLMSFFLDEDFEKEHIEWLAAVDSDDYYVQMGIAWYLATALAKQYDETVKYIEENRFSVWIHNKAIQKARESYRVPDERKEYLKSLKRVNKTASKTANKPVTDE